MKKTNKQILLIGYGNPGRQDDGLGPALAERLESFNIEGVEIDSDYQLTVEHAYDIAKKDIVIFADATVEDIDDFYFRPLVVDQSESDLSFSTHSISPQAVLGLSINLFEAKTTAYLLGIRGYEFSQIKEGLSEAAKVNLDNATLFISQCLQTKTFQ
jgi:hydrogenase maturation protease